MRKWLYFLFLLIVPVFIIFAQEGDPFLWLEKVDDEQALNWVREQNERSLGELKSDPRYSQLEKEAIEIYTSKDRIPEIYGVDGKWVYNLWKDEENPRGIFRRTTRNSYHSDFPNWETIIDLDQLAKEEEKNWVWGDLNCLPPKEDFCLLSLSDGGKDAKIVREFRISSRSFINQKNGGFYLPEAKSHVSWFDEDTVFVTTDFGEESLTESKYPRIIKMWKRGTPLSEAKTILEGKLSDVSVWSWVDIDSHGKRIVILGKNVTFYDSEQFLFLENGSLKPLPLPSQYQSNGILNNQIILTLQQDWEYQGRTWPMGDLVSFDLETEMVRLIYHPSDSESVRKVQTTKNTVLVPLLDNVVGKVKRFRQNRLEDWIGEEIHLPGIGSISIAYTDDKSDEFFLLFENPTTPDTLYHVSKKNKLTAWKQLPAFYDSSDVVVEQRWATSKDGTRVPYFVVAKKSVLESGSASTLLYGYGGFRIAMEASYSGIIGKLWLERGGIYALANIRGGGEFGPLWHKAALKHDRQKAYDDFHAIAEALIYDKVTTSRQLGIEGGSNGGLLMGVAFTQRPDLYHAVVCQVPLLDMLRYHELPPGASWIGEYGDPRIQEDYEVLASYSPYQNLFSERHYPKVFFITSSKDDRVHPAHARKMAAKMESFGYPFFYYENVDGGHGAGKNPLEKARRNALEYTYLWKMLKN